MIITAFKRNKAIFLSWIPPLLSTCWTTKREGFEFMLDCLLGKRPFIGQACILVDGMGLGTTLQAIVVAFTLFEQTDQFENFCCKMILAVCPTSWVSNWQHEFAKWIGSTCCCDAFLRGGKCISTSITQFQCSLGAMHFDCVMRGSQIKLLDCSRVAN